MQNKEQEQDKYTICELFKEIQFLQMQVQIKENEIMSLQADLVMAKDRIKYLEGKDEQRPDNRACTCYIERIY